MADNFTQVQLPLLTIHTAISISNPLIPHIEALKKLKPVIGSRDAQHAKLTKLQRQANALQDEIYTAPANVQELTEQLEDINDCITNVFAEMHAATRNHDMINALIMKIIKSNEFHQLRISGNYHVSIIYMLRQYMHWFRDTDVYNQDIEVIEQLSALLASGVLANISVNIGDEALKASAAPLPEILNEPAEELPKIAVETIAPTAPQFTYAQAVALGSYTLRASAMQTYLIDTHNLSRFVGISGRRGILALVQSHVLYARVPHDVVGNFGQPCLPPRGYHTDSMFNWYSAPSVYENVILHNLCYAICKYIWRDTFICGVPSELVEYNSDRLVIYRHNDKLHVCMCGALIGQMHIIYAKSADSGTVEQQKNMRDNIAYWKELDRDYRI